MVLVAKSGSLLFLGEKVGSWVGFKCLKSDGDEER